MSVIPEITADTRFWKVAPGEGAHLWNLCRRDNIIAIGWPDLGDIRNLTREEFRARQQTLIGPGSDYTVEGMDQVWKFVHEIKPGDRIIANRGFSRVMGIGIVTGPCEYKDGDDVHYRHRWPVEWYDLTPREIDQRGWRATLIELQRPLFQTVTKAPPVQEEKYFKLAPYSTCWSWGECLSKNLAVLGYDDLGDVAEMQPDQEFARKVNARDTRFNKADCNAVWAFSQIPRGSHVVAVERDSGRVLGYGVTTGEYFYDVNAPRFRHRLPVQWQAATTGTSDNANRRKTLEEISQTQWNTLGGLQVTVPSPPDSAPEPKDIMTNEYPLNQILYGPPGTGKTYNSIERAVEIIDSKKYGSHAEAKVRFDELRREGRIGFVTFHQSFGYEDFVEGIRPVMDEEGTNEAHYEVRDGILKQMALQAIAASLESAITPQQAGPSFEQLWELFIERIEDEEAYEIEGLKSSRYRLSISPRGTLAGINVQGNAQGPYNASRNNIEKVWRQLSPDENPTHNKLHGIIGKGSHTNLIGAVIQELRRLKADWTPEMGAKAVVHRSITQEDARVFLSGSPDYTLQASGRRFVLIIDEINRGNISKILGELITLLEPDKRLNAANALTVTVPYSGDSFALPANLYILGTMNTADKSLALLDVALRRRFKFYEYSPDFTPKTCPQLPQAARRALLQLNHRIVLGKDRDHRIGHSFFVDVQSSDQFNEVFRTEIIPLLQEYFYNDWDGLRFVLGEDGENGTIIRALKTENKRGVRNRWQWYFDAGEEIDCLSVLTGNYFPTPSTASPDADTGDDA